MSKNLTRKGIAFGAIVALGTTLFAGAPAFAGIDNNSVSLAPNAGAEYDIIAGGNLALKANSASGVTGAGKYLKFQIEDAAAKTSVKGASSSTYAVTSSINSQLAADEVVTLTLPNTHRFKVGDKVAVTGATATTVNTTAVITETTTTTIKYVGTAVASNVSAATEDTSVKLVASTLAAGKYIFDTKADTNAADKVLSLQSTDEDVTQTVIVTAWIDDNDNGAIDTTEYQSPARTVRFLKHSDVTSTVAFKPIAVGSDATVVSTVTFSPVLNGSQLINADNLSSGAAAVVANFTRPGSSATLASASTAYSNTTKQWTITSVDMNASSGDDVELAGTQTTGWNIAQPVTANLFIGSVSITKDVVTATTSATGSRSTAAAHGLQVGDTITVASSTTGRADTTATKVLSVPTTTTFTYAALATGVDLAATAQTASSISVTKILRNFAVAGTYSAQVQLYKNSANALTSLGAATSSAGVAVTASLATIESVSSATVSPTLSNAASVYTGTTSAAFVGSVLTSTGAAAGAGLDATITATTVTSAGTVKINGTTVVTGTVVYAKTDANGQIAIALENSSALVGQSVVLDLDIQGVDAADVTATWADKVYSIVDLNDNSVISTPARTRAVADAASYTFNLQVQDQFKAPAGADIRLKAAITGNTVATQNVELSAGKATLVIADGGLTTGDTTVALTFQKLSSGVWGDVDTSSYADWNGAATEDEDTVAIQYYTQTDALTLNADAANLPSSVSADFAAATTTKALVAVDARVSNTAPTAVVVAGKAVVSGAVTNSTTGVAKSGQVVTMSGAGLLFKSGAVWSIGTASQIAADGTFAFEVYSNNPGTKVVTVTSGTLTKTASLVFTGASSAVRTLTVTTPVSVLAGATLSANILLVDGNGNGVETVTPATTPVAAYIKVSYDGPGLLSGSLPTATDSDGKANIRYLTGVSDAGIATITVKYDQNFDGDFVDATDIVVTKTVLIGSSAVVSANASVAGIKGYVATTVRNASGKAVTVTVNGRVLTPRAPNVAAQLFRFRATAGKTTVVVKVDGVTVSSRTVSVK